jgi:hypothetical protein
MPAIYFRIDPAGTGRHGSLGCAYHFLESREDAMHDDDEK